MARPKKAKSKWSLNGYGLKEEEDAEFLGLLKDADLSAAQVVRALIRSCVAASKKAGKLIIPEYSTK